MQRSFLDRRVECVWAVSAQLGEGPIWSARDASLWFVDIKSRRIHCYAVDEQRSWSAPEEVGFIAPADDGMFICGLRSGLHRFDPATGAYSLLARLEAEPSGNRVNDACIDARGRLWFGTMDAAEQRATGALYRYDVDGVQRVDEGYVIPNGPAMSPDGRTLYVVDSTERVICAVDVCDDGSLANARVFARTDASAHPDGVTVDSEGCVWVALYGGWGVQRYSPQGALLHTIQLPVANCTKPAFGGPELSQLYVTTAWRGLSDAERAAQPLAGALFCIQTDVRGAPTPPVQLAAPAHRPAGV